MLAAVLLGAIAGH